MSSIRILGIAAVALLLASGARAAEATGSVAGRVVTPAGDRLPGVTLELRHETSGRELRAASGEEGLFRLAGLEPGRWRVTASLPGWPEVAAALLEVAAGAESRLDVEIPLPVFEEAIAALGAAPRESLEAPRLRESGARDVGEALEELPGVWKLRKGGIANEVVVRGAQSRDLAVLLDGQRLYGACPNKMDPAVFHVDFAEVDRVEVSKGPFDLGFAGALAGSVRIVTREPERGKHLRAELAGGDFGYWNPALVGSVRGERVSLLAGGAYRSSDPYRDGSGARVTEVANYRPGVAEERAFEIGTGWAKLGLTLDERRRLDLALALQRADRVLYPYLAMDGTADDADRARLTYSEDAAGARSLSWTAQVDTSRVEHSMDDALRATAIGRPRPYSMATDAEATTLGLSASVAGQGWTGGIEALRRGWDATNRMAMGGYAPQAMIPDVEVDVAGAHFERTIVLGERTTLAAGARLDAAESRADAARANVALFRRYHGDPDLETRDLLPAAKLRLAHRRGDFDLTFGLGHAARTPEPIERYLALARPASDWVGDPALEPARATALDVELGWERSGARLRLSLFGQRVDDQIVVVQVAADAGGKAARTFANADATLVGAELAGAVALAGNWLLSGDLSWVRGERSARRDLGLAAAPLAETPPPTARLAVRWDDGRLFGELEEVAALEQDRVDRSLGETPTPGWAVTHLRAGWRAGALVATVGVTNLLDRDYVEHLSFQRDPFRAGVRLPEPGRSWTGSVAYRF